MSRNAFSKICNTGNPRRKAVLSSKGSIIFYNGEN